MKLYSEKSLANFEFWSGAIANAEMLTTDELELVDSVLEDTYPDGMSETELNDLFWFDFETVCEMIGLKYDANEDRVIRDED